MIDQKFYFVKGQNLREDIGVMIHRYVCRLKWRPGYEEPLRNIARKAKIPLKTLRLIYYARRPVTNTEEIGAIEWACEEVLKKAKGKEG